MLLLGSVAVESLLSMGEDSIKDHVIKVNPPVENDGWLHSDLVIMATYILHTCPIHTRYVRRGLGEHRTKGAKEYFLSSKQVRVANEVHVINKNREIVVFVYQRFTLV